ncbi:hypothetical protein VTO73DRAFT_5852 [Trametes versicolor]
MRTTSFLLALAAVVPSFANPLHMRLRRDSVAPPITNPTAGTVWRAGETQMITWDVEALHGVHPSNPLAKIYLGTVTPQGEEKFMLGDPLASGFPILGGNVNLTVPSVPSGDNYFVCVFGSTRDTSAAFTIIGVDTDEGTPSQSPLIFAGGHLAH